MASTLDEVCYTTRERVQQTVEQADSVRNNRRIDDCVRAASRDVSGRLHRRFWPQTAVRYPDVRWVAGSTLWLDHADYEVLALTSIVVDGVTFVENVDYYLDYQHESGAYSAIRLIRESSAAWSSIQRGIVLTGTFGGSNGSDAAGDLVATINSSVTQLTVTNSALAGVGDLLLADSERMLVTEKEFIDSTATVTGSVAASNATTTIPVSSGALLNTGEVILVGAERMFIESISGNNLTVKRAANASVLAAHASPDVVYVPRLCTVRRAAAGTTAAAHTAGADLTRNAPPSLIAETALALAINYVEQGASGYARTIGSGESERQASGRGIADVFADAYTAYGRKGRQGHRNV
jgi:hypothetical protein